MSTAPVKALALVVFLAAVGGAAYGVQVVLGDAHLAGAVVGLQPAHAERQAAPGHAVTFAVTLQNRGTEDQALAVSVAHPAAAGATSATVVPASSAATVFLTLEIPPSAAPGAYEIPVAIRDAQGTLLRERPGALRLTVLPPGPGFATGDTGEVHYTVRVADTGRVHQTNDPALKSLPFLRMDLFTHADEPIPVPSSALVRGALEALQGMQMGESRTVTFGPEKGYGPASTESTQPRDTVIARDYVLEVAEESAPREQFDAYIENTGQGSKEEFQAGDTFFIDRGENRFRNRIVDINPGTVTFRLEPQLGDVFTLFPMWPNATRVSAVNETAVTFRTSATSDLNAPFTFRSYLPEYGARSYWPNMSALVKENTTHLVVRHSPPVGFQYTIPGQPPFSSDRSYTIKELTETEIVLSTPSANALAGRTLTVDVTLIRWTPGS